MKKFQTMLVLGVLAGATLPALATDVDQILLDKKMSGAYEEMPSTTPVFDRSAECDAAAVLTIGSVVSGTTVGAPNLVQTGAPDVFYQVLVPVGGVTEFTLCGGGTSYDSYLYLYNACPNDGGSLIAANDDFCGLQSRISMALNAGVYWLVVSGYSTSAGSYALTINGTAPVPCAMACDFTIGSGAASYNSSISSSQVHWYCVTGDPALTTISTCNAGTGFDTILDLWYNGPAGCVQLALDDDDYDCLNGGLLTTLGDADSPFSMVAGGQYFIGVRGWSASAGNYQLDINGGAPEVDANEQPLAFSLGQAVPNPFNPSTTISYSVAETSVASLTVYDLAGHAVATLVDGMVEAGSHSVVFDGSNLASGVYFYTLRSGASVQSQKMVLVK